MSERREDDLDVDDLMGGTEQVEGAEEDEVMRDFLSTIAEVQSARAVWAAGGTSRKRFARVLTFVNGKPKTI